VNLNHESNRLLVMLKKHTLNDAVWNNETLPPDEELIDHSYLDRAMQPATSLGFASVVSFVIKMPSSGCHSRGGTDVVG
jgi:hypothetical protein